jgi:hypothetical protein
MNENESLEDLLADIDLRVQPVKESGCSLGFYLVLTGLTE